LSQSAADAGDKLIGYIYGILRSSNEDRSPIMCYFRNGASQAEEQVEPLIEIDGEMVPTLDQVDGLDEEERLKWFWKILGFDPDIMDQIKEIIPTELILDSSLLDQFITLFMALVFFCSDFPHDIWLEFVYAQLVNLLCIGYFGSGAPKLLQFDQTLVPK